MDLQESLRRHFGFAEFRPGQQTALDHVLDGRDALVVMPTGSGKSLIYQLAALFLPGTTLVISPLVALMKDQVDGLARRRIAATVIDSSLDPQERAHRLRAVADRRYKMVLVAPERLRSRALRTALKDLSVSLLVVDEAHCVSQWGHDFRPDYLHLAEARRSLLSPVTLALTATATPRVQEDIIRLLGLPRAECVITGFNRSNVAFEVVHAADVKAKLSFLANFLRTAEGAGIVYVGTRRDAEEVAGFIRDVVGQQAQHYHGALDPTTRTQVQEAFLGGDLPIIVATNAFGMGIDRPDVRFVLHYAVPGTLEAYYQEAGRGGRDGLPARALLLYSPKDSALQEFFIDNDSPSAHDLQAVHAFLSNNRSATRDDIERATGLPNTKARVALEQLEIAGALRRGVQAPFGDFEVEVLPLSDSGLKAIAQQVAARRQHRREQLRKMVNYAETNACRRRILLDHFGDPSAAQAERCCDNCLDRARTAAAPPRLAQTRPEYAALIVLDAVHRLSWAIGKTKLAQLLKGSKAKDVALYRQARYYGKFAALEQPDIESLIDQLVRLGHLKQVGGLRPVMQLTARGETALKTRAAIDVALRSLAKSGGGGQQPASAAQSVSFQPLYLRSERRKGS